MRGDALILLALLFARRQRWASSAGLRGVPAGGLPPRQSAAIAALVNTRGLTELIALNVGLQAGLIHQRLFTVLVLMALLTTLMTGPLLALVGVRRLQSAAEPQSAPTMAAGQPE